MDQKAFTRSRALHKTKLNKENKVTFIGFN